MEPGDAGDGGADRTGSGLFCARTRGHVGNQRHRWRTHRRQSRLRTPARSALVDLDFQRRLVLPAGRPQMAGGYSHRISHAGGTLLCPAKQQRLFRHLPIHGHPPASARHPSRKGSGMVSSQGAIPLRYQFRLHARWHSLCHLCHRRSLGASLHRQPGATHPPARTTATPLEAVPGGMEPAFQHDQLQWHNWRDCLRHHALAGRPA